jgi:hypothetical protein
MGYPENAVMPVLPSLNTWLWKIFQFETGASCDLDRASLLRYEGKGSTYADNGSNSVC